MNHAEHDESIGSMLASIATALREVSDKLDIVAARVQLDVPTFPVDEDVPDHIRIRRLESWAFRASQDISRLSSRLDALDNDGEPDSGRPVRGTRSRREVREAAEAAERATDGLDDHQRPSDPLPPHRNRDDDGSRPPLERRSSPARPTTDHLGDPTALAATPVPRTEAAAPFGQPTSFDSDPVVTAGGNGAGGEAPTPSRRPAPTRLSGAASTGSPSGERVAAASVGNTTSTNGTNGAAHGVAGDIASPRNGTPVPAVIGTVLTAPAVERTPGPSGSASTRGTATALSEDRAPTSGPDGADNGAASGSDTAAIATLPGSADVSTVVREGDVTIGGVNGFGIGSGAMKHVSGSPVEAQAARTEADAGDPLTGEISSDAGIERARPVKKPTEGEATGGDRLGVPSPDRLSSNGNGVTSAEARSGGNTANGIHWSFTEEPAPIDRNEHARNGFTTGSTRRAESLFDDFTPHDRLTTGETPGPQTVSGPPPRLTPPTELTTQSNHVSVDPPRIGSSSHVNGAPDISDSPASPSRPANTGGLPGHNGRPDHAPLTSHAALTNHDHPDVADPPTLGLPTGRGLSSSLSDPLERPVADPIPPTATDSAGITVTGTYRAFDIETAHVDKLQAMLDELKRSAGLPPGRRDVFGPPTPDLG
ncbi:hypothetical protein [Nocardia sp. XZ_19_231]|uniref:hypothetical protein n=1 Tax=Nocardia sp. XZ_19_231 TaxID=2769252 RepID=UPI00188EFA17|nr:hypothetical protein [Nocardia sp. XZ_19_231]